MNGILANLLGNFVGNRGGQAPRPVGYRSSVQVGNGDAAYDEIAEVLALITAAAHADFTKIWQMTVPAQQRIHWGFGSPALPHNQGYMWFASMETTTPSFDVGILRIEQRRAREVKGGYVVAEIPDSSLHTPTATSLATATPTNRNEMIALPEKVEFPFVGEDSLLVLTYALTTPATAAHVIVAFQMPITVYQ
ncbi:hypothetical protein ES703_94528 [subsurface metagenome]